MFFGRLKYVEPPVSEPSAFQVNSVIEEVSSYKSPGIDGILA
jgi:hypothetical protein